LAQAIKQQGCDACTVKDFVWLNKRWIVPAKFRTQKKARKWRHKTGGCGGCKADTISSRNADLLQASKIVTDTVG